jgi:hypothetical protein
MATLSTGALTLLEWAKRNDPDGKVAKTVELLSQTNEILTDMLWVEGNLPTGYRVTQRTGLPTVYWRLMNQGTPTSKSTTAQIDEAVGLLNAWAEVDKDIAELNGNVNQTRMNEAMSFLEAMNQESAATLIYGTNVNPEEYVGFMPRYSDLSAANGENILDAGGTGSDNMSCLLVGWGGNEVFGTFPKGSKAGIEHENLGLVTVETTAGVAGNRMRAYQDHWTWKQGLVLKDWRYAVRVANIDVSDLVAQTGTQALTAATSITKMMSRAIDRLPRLAGIKPSFYANRTLLSHLRVVAQEKSSSAVTITEATNQFGESIFTTRFLGIPVRLVDALTEAEAQVT